MIGIDPDPERSFYIGISFKTDKNREDIEKLEKIIEELVERINILERKKFLKDRHE